MSGTAVIRFLWLLALALAGVTITGVTLGWRQTVHSAWSRSAAAPLEVHVMPAGSHLSILWLGDTMLGDALEALTASKGYMWPLEAIRPYLDADFVIANAEAPITTRTDHWNPDQPWTYNADPASARALAESGIDALGIANNHILDRGPDGLLETLQNARSAGLLTIGAGVTVRDAEAPLLVRSPMGTVGIVALGEDPGRRRTAAPDTIGILGLNRTMIHRGIQLARGAGADWVVAFVHWGQNYSGVNEAQRGWARIFADAGYDLVVGHHPHVVQPIEIIDGMPVVYSLGNFVFGTPGRYTEEQPGYGLMLTTELGNMGPIRLRVRCIATDNKLLNFQPRTCASTEADSVIASLHPSIQMDGATGVLQWTARPRKFMSRRGR